MKNQKYRETIDTITQNIVDGERVERDDIVIFVKFGIIQMNNSKLWIWNLQSLKNYYLLMELLLFLENTSISWLYQYIGTKTAH